jgi:hypothetical protein
MSRSVAKNVSATTDGSGMADHASFNRSNAEMVLTASVVVPVVVEISRTFNRSNEGGK